MSDPVNPIPPPDTKQARCTVIADLNRGESIQQVASYLVKDGWNEEEALAFVTTVQSEEENHRANAEEQADRSSRVKRVAVRNMTIGGGIFLAAAIMTGLSYLAQGSTTGEYIVWYGALIFGAARFVIGWNAYRKL